MLILQTRAGEVCHLACDLKAKSFLPQLGDERGSPWPEVGVQWPCPKRASVPLTPDSWSSVGLAPLPPRAVLHQLQEGWDGGSGSSQPLPAPLSPP